MRNLLLTICLLCFALSAPMVERQLAAQAKKVKKADPPEKTEQPKAEVAKPQPRVFLKVSSISKESYTFKFGKPLEQGVKLELLEFDISGNRTVLVRFDDGRVVERRTSRYDENGKKAEERTYDEDSVFTAWTGYSYDASKNLVEEIKYSPRDSSVSGKLEFRYDANGNKVEEILYDEGGSIERKVLNSYDANKNKTEVGTYRSDGTLVSKKKLVYDTRGKRLQEAIEYAADGNVESKTTYKYNPGGNLIEETLVESDGHVIAMHEYKYDAAGNKIEFAKSKSENRLEFRERYKYEAKSKAETAFYDSDDAFTHKITFRYDTNGNVVEETEHDKLGEPQKMIRYIITYFP